MAPQGENSADVIGGPARLLKAPYWGTLAIAVALGLNPIFSERLLDALPMSRPWPHILVLLAAVAGILVFGVTWQPFRVARRDETFPQSIERMMGRWPARLIYWGLIPLALLCLFHLHFLSLHWFVMRTCDYGEFFPRGSPAWPWVGIATTVLLGLLAWLGCWDSWSGFGRSAIWLVQVSLMGWLGLIASYLPAIPAGAVRARTGWAMNYDFSIGVFLLWFGLPLMLMGTRFAATLPSRVSSRPGLPLWLGLTAVLFVLYLLVRNMYFGALGTFPKFYSLLGGAALDTRLGLAKVMVLSLGMLVTLRLGPRLLADLWDIAPQSPWRAALVASMVVVSAKAPPNWFADDTLAALAVPVVALAGTLNGAEWGAVVRRRGGARFRKLAADGMAAPTWRRWCFGIWMGGLLLTTIVPHHRHGVLAAIWELSHQSLEEIALNVGASLYGLLHIWEFHWSPNFYAGVATIIVAWLICFVGAFVLGFRYGMPTVLDATGDASA